jgi:histidinol-phosphate/aromatic aminotransferase/cobyric acid decarboxylase-like protein
VLAALQAALKTVQRYPSPDYPELRPALAHHHGLEKEWVLPGNGAAELLTWAGRELATLNKTALFTPAFADYGRSLRAFAGHVQPCPLPLRAAMAGSVDWVQTLDPHLPPQQQRTSWGLLLNTPHNPTGLQLTPDIVRPWLDQFGLVVVDEAFMDFLPVEHQTSLIKLVDHHPNLVVLRSLTKFYSLPGLRLGYAIGHPDRWQRWQQWRDPWPVNTLAAAAAIAALKDTEYQQAVWQWLPSARTQLSQGLSALPGLTPFPGVANYLLVQTQQMSGPDLQYRLLTEHRIFIRDCLSFPELGDRYVRVAVRTETDNQQLLSALAAVLA